MDVLVRCGQSGKVLLGVRKSKKLVIRNEELVMKRRGAHCAPEIKRYADGLQRRAEVILQRTISCPAGQFTLSRPTKKMVKVKLCTNL